MLNELPLDRTVLGIQLFFFLNYSSYPNASLISVILKFHDMAFIEGH